jgi:putative flippase GtrA
MSPATRDGFLRLLEEHGLKLLRYCGVSVVNVVTGITTLAVCLDVFEMQRVAANVTAWMVSTVPAYLLSRYWVWQQRGANSVRSELAPFWILALVGLVFSTLCVWVAGFFTESTLALIAVNFCAYGVVWVAKYLVIERLLWGEHHEGSVEVEVV